MSTGAGSAPAINYSSFHILYRNFLLAKRDVSARVVDCVILPQRLPQLYNIWRNLGEQGTNPREAVEVARKFAERTIEEGRYNAQATKEESYQRVYLDTLNEFYQAS